MNLGKARLGRAGLGRSTQVKSPAHSQSVRHLGEEVRSTVGQSGTERIAATRG